MPLYEDENTTREKLYELRKKNRCQVCGRMLNVFLDFDSGKAFLACNDWPRTHHEGIEREAREYELNIPTRREMMVEELGTEKATRLIKYEGVVSLTKAEAMEILATIWPDAPEVEVMKAAMVCHQYGLNPLMKHIFLIPFKKRKEGKVVGEDWVVVQGISSNRLIARRRHNYSYLDVTPRRMTEEEQEKIKGEVDDTKIWAITKLKDIQTGAEAMGIGSWPVDEVPYGTEKGNTKLNMACIRSERAALDRLYPAEMPQGVEVIDEEYAPPLIAEGGDKIGGAPGQRGAGEGETNTPILSPPKQEPAKKIGVPAAEAAKGEGFSIDLPWLHDALKQINWTHDTAKSWLSKFNIDTQGTLEEVIKRLAREQAVEFVKEIQDRAAKKQLELFE